LDTLLDLWRLTLIGLSISLLFRLWSITHKFFHLDWR
jgi:hypothetical protein